MDALEYIITKYDLPRHAQHMPIEIPNTDRADLARLFYLLGYQRGAEVGVERGVYSEVLCRANQGLELLCVDPWKAYRGYRDHVNQEKLDRFYDETGERLKAYRATRVRKFSLDAAKDVRDGSLDFVYLDGNHSFENVVCDLAAWCPKVRVGGIVAGHDYVRSLSPSQVQVEPAVRGWTKAHEVYPWFVLGTKEDVPGQKRESARSFFWVVTEANGPRGRVIR